MFSSPSSPAPEAQLLLVEDNRSQAAIMERMLEEGGIELEIAHVGTLAEAKDFLNGARVACIVLDLTLPDASRLEGLMEVKISRRRLPWWWSRPTTMRREGSRRFRPERRIT